MIEKLTALQRRILGVLMEKALATPAYYPMTVNAIVAAANQKSNRNPVSAYTESEISHGLRELCGLGLATQASGDPGSRAVRFEHKASEVLEWSRRHRAVMAELLLRGPQTLNELKTRTQRMVPLPDMDSVQSLLNELSEMEPSRVMELERAPGQAANRFSHTMYEEDEDPAAGQVAAPVAASTAAADPGLSQRVEKLEQEVEDLRYQLRKVLEKIGDIDDPEHGA